jgi:molecular chaperone GrpE
MSRLFRNLYRREFPLVANPLPVYFSSDQSGRDLLTMTTETMRENERLGALARSLESRQGDPAELEKMIRNLLPTLDGFDRVLHLGRSYPQDEVIDNWLKSVESIYFRLLTTLENYGLYQMRTVGSKVDLNLHEVVEYRPSADHDNDTVISERQKGYILRGKLLRDAKVVVVYNERSR